MRSNPAFERGLAASTSGGGLLLVALYTLYAPTSDIRARVPFLLDLGGGLLALVALSILFAAGTVALRLTRPLSKEAMPGVALGSVANLMVLASGVVPRVLPSFERAWQRAATFGLAVALLAMLLWRQRLAERAGSSRHRSTTRE